MQEADLCNSLPGSADMKFTGVRKEMGQVLGLEIHWGLNNEYQAQEIWIFRQYFSQAAYMLILLILFPEHLLMAMIGDSSQASQTPVLISMTVLLRS